MRDQYEAKVSPEGWNLRIDVPTKPTGYPNQPASGEFFEQNSSPAICGGVT